MVHLTGGPEVGWLLSACALAARRSRSCQDPSPSPPCSKTSSCSCHLGVRGGEEGGDDGDDDELHVEGELRVGGAGGWLEARLMAGEGERGVFNGQLDRVMQAPSRRMPPGAPYFRQVT